MNTEYFTDDDRLSYDNIATLFAFGYEMKVDVVGFPLFIASDDANDKRHKYNTAMAEYFDFKDSTCADDSTGDTNFGYASLFGNWIQWGDSNGFATAERFDDEDSARQAFDDFHEEYVATLDDEDY